MSTTVITKIVTNFSPFRALSKTKRSISFGVLTWSTWRRNLYKLLRRLAAMETSIYPAWWVQWFFSGLQPVTGGCTKHVTLDGRTRSNPIQLHHDRPHRTPRDDEFTRSARAIMPPQRNRRTTSFAAARGEKSAGMTFPLKIAPSHMGIWTLI